MLETECAYFDRLQPSFLTVYPGKFVLIKGEELISVFDTFDDALQEGAKRFGSESFLIRRVDQSTEQVSIPALAVGVLYANSAYPV